MSYTKTCTEVPVFNENAVSSTLDIHIVETTKYNDDIKVLAAEQLPEIKATVKEANPIFNTLNLNVVEHPDHYGASDGGLQCIEAMLQTFGKDATMAFCKLNAFKYIWRSDHKAKEVQDMEKAKRYLEYWHVLNNINGNKDDGSFHDYLNS